MPHTTPRALPLRARSFLFCLVCCPVIPLVAPLSFNIDSFYTDLSDILYEGVTELAIQGVDLTKLYPRHPYKVGRNQYAKPVPIWDPVTGRHADFSTDFSFTIETDSSAHYSDGLAFFLAPVGFPIPLNSEGGFLGLFNATTAKEGHQNRIIMVEFDTYVNRDFDPPVHHIGININSLSSVVHDSWNPANHSEKATDVLVTYNSTSKNLSVFWSFDDKKTYTRLSYLIDLASVLPNSAAIGFSASFGFHVERHSINSWKFTSNLEVNSKPRRLRIPVVVHVACFLLVIFAGSCFFAIKRGEKYGFRALIDIDKEIGAFVLNMS
ncbi:hypothetical protein NL676_021722 [Syzygium grande]|nr:hypothetical protein NL676_021722 [Syzygium grande]